MQVAYLASLSIKSTWPAEPPIFRRKLSHVLHRLRKTRLALDYKYFLTNSGHVRNASTSWTASSQPQEKRAGSALLSEVERWSTW